LYEDCPDQPVPMMVLHGTADSYVSYEGGASDELAETAKRLGATPAQTAMFGGAVLNPIDYIDRWLEHNGCQDHLW
jgi:poly(3-hydroxybutyrate) depolymerase